MLDFHFFRGILQLKKISSKKPEELSQHDNVSAYEKTNLQIKKK